MLKPAAFLDRDGVINVDKGYVYKIEEFEWINGAVDAIKLLAGNNFHVFVVTNQSGIARGYYTEQDVIALHKHINKELKRRGTLIDDFFYSPYHPDFPNLFSESSNLRKPNTGMLEMADNKWSFDKPNSFLIGDKNSDLECANRFGIKGYKFDSENLNLFIKNIL